MQTSGYKLAPAQYKPCYCLAPPQSLLRKQVKTKLMLCRPLCIILWKSYITVQKQSTSIAKVGMAHS